MYKFIKNKINEFFTTEPVVGIEKEALEFILEVGSNSHPNEFGGLLYAEKRDGMKVITDMYLAPNARTNESSVFYERQHVPNSINIVGSVHSHPNGVIQPSDEDLSSFTAGTIHIIVGYPYTLKDWKAYNKNGEIRKLEIIEQK